MRVLLVISSSGVLFYLVLLFQLYRDGRRNRNRVVVLHESEIGGKSATRFETAPLGVTALAQRPKLPDRATRLPVTRFEWKPAQGVAQSDLQQTGTLATPVGRVNRS